MFFRSLSFASVACALAIGSCHAQDASELFKGQTVRPKRTAPKSNRPAQNQLAHKGAFPSIAANSALVRGAIPATNLQAARAKLNQDAHIVGTITKVYTPASHARVLLNFARNYKGAVVGLVDARNFSQFPDLSQLAGKRVVLSGHVIAYKDEIEIALDTSNSIRVVK